MNTNYKAGVVFLKQPMLFHGADIRNKRKIVNDKKLKIQNHTYGFLIKKKAR